MSFLIQPRRSLALFLFFVIIHCGALYVLIVEPLSWLPQLLLISSVIASFIYILRRHVLLINGHSVSRCWREMDGSWHI